MHRSATNKHCAQISLQSYIEATMTTIDLKERLMPRTTTGGGGMFDIVERCNNRTWQNVRNPICRNYTTAGSTHASAAFSVAWDGTACTFRINNKYNYIKLYNYS